MDWLCWGKGRGPWEKMTEAIRRRRILNTGRRGPILEGGEGGTL